MALESATYVNGLNSSNPAATDGLSQADDHLRLLKSTIKNTFPNLSAAVTATAAELNKLDGATVTTAELNKLDGFTGSTEALNYAQTLYATGVTQAEFDVLDGITATTTELNRLDGFTGTVASLNYAEELRATGVTATEFNKIDGLTANASELNKLDGCTATTTELNKLDGVSGTIWHDGNDALSTSNANDSSGYVKLPNGLYIQWGVYNSGSASHNDFTVTFPIAFPSYCFTVVTSIGSVYDDVAIASYMASYSRSRTGFQTYSSYLIPKTNYIAIGK